MENNENINDWIKAMENNENNNNKQACISETGDLANIVSSYFLNLISTDILTREEALVLTIEFQNHMLGANEV